MALRYRPIRPSDVQECVEIVKTHPTLGPQYGSDITVLRTVWLSLMGREAFRAVVFEDAEGSQIRIMGVGVSAFVSHDFLLELKTPPFFWIGPELAKRVFRGESPLLSDKQVRQANADGGLNLVTWAGALHRDYLQSMDAYTAMFTAFVAEHRGFLLSEVVSNTVSVETLEGTIRSGGLYFTPVHRRYVDSVNKPLHKIVAEPHLVGLTRELAMARFGTWIGSLFVYQPPEFGFSPSEQRLLLAALRSGTDEDLAETLEISVSAVKKTWRSIYNRVTPISPSLIPDKVPEELNSERGKEKKQRLLAYLREHLEELRPASF